MTLTAHRNRNLSHSLYQQDPLAKETSWKPLKTKNELKNMILKSIEGSLEFHFSVLSRLLYAVLIVLGSMFIFYATYALLSYQFQATFISVSFGFTLLGFGIYMFSKHDVPLVFDKKKNLYFKQTQEEKMKDKTSLNDIHAVQILSYDEDEAKKAELNLVLEDGERVYVCSYDDDEHSLEKIQKDASKIAEYIEKPVWNALEKEKN